MKKDIFDRLDKKSIFLTGGTGFFGKSFLDSLIKYKNSHNVHPKLTILTRDSNSFIKQFPELYQKDWMTFVDGDLRSFIFPEGKFDYILHFATPANAAWNISHPLEMYETIAEGTRRVLDFAVECGASKVLLTSSGAVYGKQPSDCTHITEVSPSALNPIQVNAAYGEAKRVAEFLGATYSRKYGMEFKIARCFAFVGPYLDPKSSFAISNFIWDAIIGNPITVQGDGTARRSYLYSADLMIWLVKILLDGKSNTPYNVGSDQDLTIEELAESVVKVLDCSSKISILSPKTPGQVPERYVPSIEKARTELGLEIFTSLEEAIRLTAVKYQEFL